MASSNIYDNTDYSTLSNHEKFNVDSMHMEWDVSFKQKRIGGFVAHAIKVYQ